jgi:hypothetical protein
MGNAAPSSGPGDPPTSPSLEDLKNIGINNTWAPGDNTCCPVTDDANGSCGKKGFRWPDNGEFTWGGLGDGCQTVCAFNYGNRCGTAGISGKKPRVKRIAYNANKELCCEGKSQLIDGRTCDPDFMNPTSNGCAQVLYKKCTGNMPFTNEACISWCSKNQELCDTNKINYCASNLSDPDCRQYAIKLSQGGRNDLDSAVTGYCSKNPEDPFCSCKPMTLYTGTNEELKILNAPQCFETNCINYGYKNKSQLSFRCPSTICSNKINVSDIKASNVSNIVQTCNVNKGGSEKDAILGKKEESYKKGVNPIDNKIKIYIILFIVLIIAVALAFILTSKPSGAKERAAQGGIYEAYNF